uniref:Uncharacterized protein n=1 Tax=Cucumis melo TaxID=3656 RepID=A0A9I9EFH7_CUCME
LPLPLFCPPRSPTTISLHPLKSPPSPLVLRQAPEALTTPIASPRNQSSPS